jgi:hypothetical protein
MYINVKKKQKPVTNAEENVFCIQICWILGHLNIKGNEIRNHAAKYAVTDEVKTIQDYDKTKRNISKSCIILPGVA